MNEIDNLCNAYLQSRSQTAICAITEWADIGGFFSSWQLQNRFPEDRMNDVVSALVEDISNSDRAKACAAALAVSCIVTHHPHGCIPLISELDPSISDRILRAADGADRLCKFNAMRAMENMSRIVRCDLRRLIAFLNDPDAVVRGGAARALGGFTEQNSWLTSDAIQSVVEPGLAAYAKNCPPDECVDALVSLLQLQELQIGTLEVLVNRIAELGSTNSRLAKDCLTLKAIIVRVLSNRASGSDVWSRVCGRQNFATHAMRNRIGMGFGKVALRMPK